MSMEPVAAAISAKSSGATKWASGRPPPQSILWPGPAMKPSSDIDLFTTTLPVPVLVSLICSSVPPLPSGRLVVPESVERGRIDDPAGQVGAVAREPLHHERLVRDLRMRGDEAERARPLEAEARIVGGDALDHEGGLARLLGPAERVPDQVRAHP